MGPRPPATSLKGVMFRRSLKLVGGAHKLLYRASGGRVGGTVWGLSILLLTTRGRKTGKLRVYVQGNIHGGEVEGKESAQMLLRDLADGRHDDWLREMVFLIAPISYFAAPFGANMAHEMDRKKLRGVFAFFIAVTAGRMLYDALF